ncbi:hypothetical protein Dimus_039592 [Dionaea muscipula]
MLHSRADLGSGSAAIIGRVQARRHLIDDGIGLRDQVRHLRFSGNGRAASIIGARTITPSAFVDRRLALVRRRLTTLHLRPTSTAPGGRAMPPGNILPPHWCESSMTRGKGTAEDDGLNISIFFYYSYFICF